MERTCTKFMKTSRNELPEQVPKSSGKMTLSYGTPQLPFGSFQCGHEVAAQVDPCSGRLQEVRHWSGLWTRGVRAVGRAPRDPLRPLRGDHSLTKRMYIFVYFPTVADSRVPSVFVVIRSLPKRRLHYVPMLSVQINISRWEKKKKKDYGFLASLDQLVGHCPQRGLTSRHGTWWL